MLTDYMLYTQICVRNVCHNYKFLYTGYAYLRYHVLVLRVLHSRTLLCCFTFTFRFSLNSYEGYSFKLMWSSSEFACCSKAKRKCFCVIELSRMTQTAKWQGVKQWLEDGVEG